MFEKTTRLKDMRIDLPMDEGTSTTYILYRNKNKKVVVVVALFYALHLLPVY